MNYLSKIDSCAEELLLDRYMPHFIVEARFINQSKEIIDFEFVDSIRSC